MALFGGAPQVVFVSEKENRQVKTETLSEFYESENYDIEENYQNRDLIRRIYELIDKESERTRDILLMRIDGYSFTR